MLLHHKLLCDFFCVCEFTLLNWDVNSSKEKLYLELIIFSSTSTASVLRSRQEALKIYKVGTVRNLVLGFGGGVGNWLRELVPLF